MMSSWATDEGVLRSDFLKSLLRNFFVGIIFKQRVYESVQTSKKAFLHSCSPCSIETTLIFYSKFDLARTRMKLGTGITIYRTGQQKVLKLNMNPFLRRQELLVSVVHNTWGVKNKSNKLFSFSNIFNVDEIFVFDWDTA